MTPEEYARRKAIVRAKAWRAANLDRARRHQLAYYYRNRERLLAERRRKRHGETEEGNQDS